MIPVREVHLRALRPGIGTYATKRRAQLGLPEITSNTIACGTVITLKTKGAHEHVPAIKLGQVTCIRCLQSRWMNRLPPAILEGM